MRHWLATITPVVTAILFECASIGQIFRIWSEQTSAGQNVTSWVSVLIAQALWLNFYRVKLPSERLAAWSCISGMAVNSILLASIVYWRMP